jgi:hypothetical protein
MSYTYAQQPICEFPAQMDGKGGRRFTLFGHTMPDNVVWVEMGYDSLNDSKIIRWIAKDGSKHEMPCSPDNIEAVAVAMKISG